MTQDVEIAIIRADLEKDMLRAIPLVEHFLDNIFVTVQAKANGALIRLPPRVTMDLQGHTRSFLLSTNAAICGNLC